MIRVIIADDHTVIRKGLLALLSSEKYGIEVIGEAGDGLQAVELSDRLRPDLILMDLQMPKMNGLVAIKEILHHDPTARILVLTSFGEDEKVATAIRAGALGYLLKDSSPDELVSAIHAVAMGLISLPQELSTSLFKVPVSTAGSGEEEGVEALTAREMDVLRCLADGDSNKEIASRLSLSLTTVRTHVSNILRKLNMDNRTQAALYAREKKLSD